MRWNALINSSFLFVPIQVEDPNVQYSPDTITSNYEYKKTLVDSRKARVVRRSLTFQTQRRGRNCHLSSLLSTDYGPVPKTGVMLVGWGGNNGTTITAGVLANKLGMSWETKEGTIQSNYFGSVTQASTVKLGYDTEGRGVFTPLKVFQLILFIFFCHYFSCIQESFAHGQPK